MVKFSLVLGFGSVATAAAQKIWPCTDEPTWLAHDEIHGKGAALHHTDEGLRDEDGNVIFTKGHKTNPSMQDWKGDKDASIANCDWVAGNPAKHCKKYGTYTDGPESVEMKAESACRAACNQEGKEVKGPGCGEDSTNFWIKYEAKIDEDTGKNTGEYEEDRGCLWVEENPAGRCGKVGTMNVARENKDGNMEDRDIQVTANFACVGTCAAWKAYPANVRKPVKKDWDSDSDRK